MQAVILAAGAGTRMRPLTAGRPKGMLPIANRPILEHIVIQAGLAGISDFVLVVGQDYKDELITRYFGDGRKWGVKISYRTQPHASGTADALRVAQDAVSQRFLVLNGDILIDASDIRQMMQSNEITIGVKHVADPSGLGVIEEDNGVVRHIFEKPEVPPSNLINTGVYLMTQDIFPAIGRTVESSRGELELTRSLEALIEEGVSVHCERVGTWQDIGYPWDLLEANAHILSEMDSVRKGVVEENVHIVGHCDIGAGSIIRSGAYIVGPVRIGEGCDIGPNCFIRPATSIGDGCRIGAGVEIKNSIIMRETKIPHLSYVGDSVIGEGCNLGAGTQVANLRLDRKTLIIDGRDTKRHKLGVIMGDRVMTGINANINAGTVIGNNAWIGPGVLASGVIPDGAHLSHNR